MPVIANNVTKVKEPPAFVATLEAAIKNSVTPHTTVIERRLNLSSRRVVSEVK
jgi:hypothetical protein